MEWISYGNQGATRNLPLSPDLVNALSFLPEMGLGLEVFSGGQHDAETAAANGTGRVGSTRHDHGAAGDVYFTRNGERLSWANPEHMPIFEEIVRRGRGAGLTGFGAGDGYMGEGSMHVGYGAPAVWGAGGDSANAPEWLRNAYYGAEAGPTPQGGGNNALAALPGAGGPQQGPMNALAMLERYRPQDNALNAADFMSPQGRPTLLPIQRTA